MELERAYKLLHPDTTIKAIAEIEYTAGFNGRMAAISAINEACNVACDAMDARIPKSLNDLRRHVDHDSGLCPVCGNRNTTYGEVNYCFSCGQALDWSGSNEK